MSMTRALFIVFPVCLAGCSTVQAGHMGLMFKDFGGLQRDKLQPGLYWTGVLNHIEDFDVTYSTRHEQIETASSEGYKLTLNLSVIYRPVVAEIYDLDADIGLNYYDEVVGPEFKSAARGVFARHAYLELLRKNEAIEDEVEADLRRRIAGKHVEISSVTLEALDAPEASHAIQAKLAAEQDALHQQAVQTNEDARRRMQIKNDDEQRRMQLKNDDEQLRIKAEATMRQKHQETELAKEQAELDKTRIQAEATQRLIKAKADAEELKVTAAARSEEMRLMARAEAEKARAANQTLTPLAVMMHGYDALEKLAGSNAHVYLGDWSKMPNFLFPPAFQSTLNSRRAEVPATE
jgi:regulator of protease activity HflC (stomatin/prohibitin superfamily)